MSVRWVLILVVTFLASIGDAYADEKGPPEGRVVAIQLPYVCSIRLQAVHRCSATILNPNWLLTSGQCVTGLVAPFDGLAIVCGVRMYRTVAEIVPHPSFMVANPTANNLALLLMRKPLNLTSYVQPIPLVDDWEFSAGKATIAGYDRRFEGVRVWWNPPLQLAEVTILSVCECQQRLGPTLAGYLTDASICTDASPTVEASLVTYVGDPGAPLMIATDTQPYNLLAIPAWTVAPWGTGPLVHVRVASHLDWIISVIAVN
ncbi:trypsin-1-like [Anopheles nili]|uniref:trypsin-1-like n=1 Tax=Anopheles nili TaxID=185578 RepID=UPI00237A5F0E|nr:trypsin-1-like [Anopheles nili]